MTAFSTNFRIIGSRQRYFIASRLNREVDAAVYLATLQRRRSRGGVGRYALRRAVVGRSRMPHVRLSPTCISVYAARPRSLRRTRAALTARAR